jgi:hypothetical protein
MKKAWLLDIFTKAAIFFPLIFRVLTLPLLADTFCYLVEARCREDSDV